MLALGVSDEEADGQLGVGLGLLDVPVGGGDFVDVNDLDASLASGAGYLVVLIGFFSKVDYWDVLNERLLRNLLNRRFRFLRRLSF